MATFVVLVGAGLIALVCGIVPIGPDWLPGIGSVVVASTYAWALAARTGGRPVVFGTLAIVLGVVTLVADDDSLRTGAAVMTCVVAAVLAVMATVPAVRFVQVVRECVIAMLIAGVGAMATVGFEPAITVVRFEYATFGLSLVGALLVVFRLGAGFHGLGRRGLAIVVIGLVVVAVTLLYAELLRRYGAAGMVESLLDLVRWSRTNLGAFPRPIETVLGIPALAWGCHMRARRRQGWWVCAFGVAATSAVANSLANPAIALRESGLSVLYGLVLGLLIALVVIRIDLALTGSRGSRSRRAEEAAAVRPEPARTSALL
ncbi:hypothetical protein NPS01_40550 [Nocardioides psychrotolerans]|uniref:Uncharacterized protein n=1 Tax=Nocardioides psychrotolerans TaxID=1005945 RepID=A0A1I3GRU0_9ACTN|nr:hypothetical protein NPS01_40550 [Nocardioides psychrotolerans]SFI26099.1 hypothetical protein SAMN05216561_106240 [Nocardioides psychrotolerans]